MSFKDNWLYKGLAILAPAALLFAASVSYSQETIESQEVEADSSDSEQVDRSVEEVVVTGSRLKRTTFSSISPLQIITAEISREAGLLSAADILQTSTSAGGQQIDLTFSGFVLDNGPGSRTLNLRGLGAARTLIMINGRRMAPGGARSGILALACAGASATVTFNYPRQVTVDHQKVWRSDIPFGDGMVLQQEPHAFPVGLSEMCKRRTLAPTEAEVTRRRRVVK